MVDRSLKFLLPTLVNNAASCKSGIVGYHDTVLLTFHDTVLLTFHERVLLTFESTSSARCEMKAFRHNMHYEINRYQNQTWQCLFFSICCI